LTVFVNQVKGRPSSLSRDKPSKNPVMVQAGGVGVGVAARAVGASVLAIGGVVSGFIFKKLKYGCNIF
jgi:hypothetical protein